MKKTVDIDSLRDWLLTTLHFLINAYDEHDNYGGVNYKSFFEAKIDIVETVYKKRQGKAMLLIFNDINEMCRGLPDNILNDLNEMLVKKYGRHFKNGAYIEQRGEELIQKNSINNEIEYFLLRNYRDILLEKGHNHLSRQASELIFKYEESQRQ